MKKKGDDVKIMTKEKERKRLTVRLPNNLYEGVKKLSIDKGYTLNTCIQLLLEKECKKRKLL